jgi:hypothetical protein
MKYGLLKIGDVMPREKMDEGLASFADYVADRERNVCSHADGGQIMVNFVVDDKAILWNAHLGSYEGIMKALEPKPDVAILGIAGRANSNGRPFDGSAAQYALNEVQWLEQPKTVVWCLHDERYVVELFARLRTNAENIHTQSYQTISHRHEGSHTSRGGKFKVQSSRHETRTDLQSWYLRVKIMKINSSLASAKWVLNFWRFLNDFPESLIGVGARTCLGKNISMLEMTKVIPQLYRRSNFMLEKSGED